MLKEVLRELEQEKFFGRKRFQHIEILEPKEALFGIIKDLPDSIRNYLNDNHIKLYMHQALAIKQIRNSKNVLITTPTASGKTLAFNIPIMETLSDNPNATALYIYPAKALGE